MDDLRTPTKKRPLDNDYGYDTELASPYDVEKEKEWYIQNMREKIQRQNDDYDRRQMLPYDNPPPTVILDRITDKPFYKKNSNGELEIVTSANIRKGDIFYNEDGEEIIPEFLDLTNEGGRKLRRKKSKKSKKSKKRRNKTKSKRK